MIAKRVLPVLAAVSSAAAQSTARTCTVSTTTINSQADATGLASCGTIKGSVVIGTTVAGSDLSLDGPTSIDGDLTIQDNGVLVGLSSSSIASISGAFKMDNVTALQNLQFDALTDVGSITWTSVASLTKMNFGSVISKCPVITISDTYLSSLDGIDVTTAQTMDINNNNRLTKLSLSLANLSDNLNIAANGADLAVTMSSLTWIANMTIANVTTFSAPSLEVVNGSLRFDSNYFTTFEAGNLTSTTSGDISFVGNSNMANLSFPALTSVGGGVLIANNTALSAVNGFPQLATVGGAVKLRGNFSSVEFPKLSNVKGAFDVSSTGDISSSCDTLKKLSSSGGNGDVQGVFSCTSDNAAANSDTGTNTSSTGSSGSGSSSNSSSAASGLYVGYAVLGAAGVAGFSQLLW